MGTKMRGEQSKICSKGFQVPKDRLQKIRLLQRFSKSISFKHRLDAMGFAGLETVSKLETHSVGVILGRCS